MTLRDIIAASLRRIGVLGEGQTPSAEQAADGMFAANALLDEWKSKRLQIYSITRSIATIVSGTSTYTLGTGGTTFTPAMSRPATKPIVRFQDTSQSPTLEMDLFPMTDDSYASLALKTSTSPYPQQFWLNNTYPLSTIVLWPVPTGTTLQLVVYWATAVTEFTSINDTFDLPPGYRRMVVTALALELADEYRVEPSQRLIEQAAVAMADVKNMNVRLIDVYIEPGALNQGGSVGYYNIFSDQP